MPDSLENRTGAVVAFTNVKIGFDEGDVLRGVSFEVMPRETLVLLGETGTGKTLTLKLAAGLLRPNQGKIEVLGQEVSCMQEQELLTYRRQVGFVFQEGALFDSMTVAENVAYRLREDRLSEDEIESVYRNRCGLWNWSTPGKCSPLNCQVACGGGFLSRGH